MLIVTGHLVVDASQRDAYLESCVEAVRAARAAPGCLAFSVSADPVEPDRVVVVERWEGEAQLLAFRGAGPSGEQQAAIRSAEVARYDVVAVGEA